MTSQLTAPFACALLREAADVIEANAMSLKQSHSLPCGSWLINDAADLDAFRQYMHETGLVDRLRVTTRHCPQPNAQEAHP